MVSALSRPACGCVDDGGVQPFAAHQSEHAAGACLFATAVEVITPPRPTRLACTGDFASASVGVHDDVHVRVLAVRGPDGASVLWISYELLFVSRELHNALAAHAHRSYGIDPALVTVGAVHNHNAPAAAGYNPGAADPSYDELLLHKGIAAIDSALGRLRPGRLELRRTDLDLNIQRRVVTEGRAAAGPNDGAPRDTELVLLTVTDATPGLAPDNSGVLAACVVVWACHPVFYPELTVTSGEFPARLCQLLAAERYGCTPLFFQGAAGDARPRATVVDGSFARRPFPVVDAFARDLAAEVLALLDEPGTPLDLAPRGTSFTVELPLEPLSHDEFREIADARAGNPGNPTLANALLRVDDHDQRPDHADLACTLVRLTRPADPGDPAIWLATMGGEPVNDIKEIVRDVVPGPVVFVGYTDGCAYIVSDRMLPEGGYEVTCGVSFGHLGPFAPGIDAAIGAGFTAAVAALSAAS